jgi:signal transduction histidine kinase
MSINMPQGPDLGQRLREICHDMRQPVAGILALAAAAQAEPGLPATAGHRLAQIVEQAEWLADMLEQGLCGDPDGPGGYEADIVRVVNEVVAAERLTWAGNATIVSAVEAVHSAMHPAVLRRIVANVLGNATRAAGPSGSVTIEIKYCEQSAMVVVEDSGPGFGRIPPGHGLGLPAVVRNIARYGGRVQCAPAAQGGVRVSLWLP